jgi:ADP-ribose pyrophosphatase YjhB (NUDIX family)
MGLITGLLTLPLAPVRGTVWIAERIAEQAAREYNEETRVRQELAELEMRYDLGEIGHQEYVEAEEALLERLAEATSSQSGDEPAGPQHEAEEA